MQALVLRIKFWILICHFDFLYLLFDLVSVCKSSRYDSYLIEREEARVNPSADIREGQIPPYARVGRHAPVVPHYEIFVRTERPLNALARRCILRVNVGLFQHESVGVVFVDNGYCGAGNADGFSRKPYNALNERASGVLRERKDDYLAALRLFNVIHNLINYQIVPPRERRLHGGALHDVRSGDKKPDEECQAERDHRVSENGTGRGGRSFR